MDLIKQENLNPIITSAGDVNALNFKTIDEKTLQEINDWMPIVSQKTRAFNKKNSQTTLSLMSLNMVDAAPYRVLRQILAQVNRRRSALKEVLYSIEKKKIRYKELQYMSDRSPLQELRMKKIACDIVDAQSAIEASLKELGALKRRYEEICKNKNIPLDWDEADFEEAEIEHHIKSMFRNAIRDRMQGSHNMGTMEYFHQFGINCVAAYALVDNYLSQVRNEIRNDKLPTIEIEYNFLDHMYNTFKHEYKRALKRLGLDSIMYADFLMKEGVN